MALGSRPLSHTRSSLTPSELFDSNIAYTLGMTHLPGRVLRGRWYGLLHFCIDTLEPRAHTDISSQPSLPQCIDLSSFAPSIPLPRHKIPHHCWHFRPPRIPPGAASVLDLSESSSRQAPFLRGLFFFHAENPIFSGLGEMACPIFLRDPLSDIRDFETCCLFTQQGTPNPSLTGRPAAHPFRRLIIVSHNHTFKLGYVHYSQRGVSAKLVGVETPANTNAFSASFLSDSSPNRESEPPGMPKALHDAGANPTDR